MPLDIDPASLRRRFREQLPAHVRGVIDALVARAAPAAIYAVGGCVRDLLLDRPVIDIDLVCTADAIELIRAPIPGSKLTASHTRFRTATLAVGPARIDIATARTEIYPRPGDLPRVSTPASIEDDLRRRDFSINAIALRLNGDPVLLDPCNGIADLDAEAIRVLHDASFRDDATRIYRAFRYAARLGFAIDPHMRALFSNAQRHVQHIGRSRLHRELRLMLLDEPPGVSLSMCHAAGMLELIDALLTWDDAAARAFAAPDLRGQLGGGEREIAAFGFCLLLRQATPEHAASIVRDLRLTRVEAAAVRDMAALRGTAHLIERASAKPSGIALLLDRYAPSAVAAFAGVHRDEIAGQRALRYLAEWRRVKPRLSGADLQRMGVPPGPYVSRCLQLLRAARLDGDAPGLADEQEIARTFAASLQDAAAAAERQEAP